MLFLQTVVRFLLSFLYRQWLFREQVTYTRRYEQVATDLLILEVQVTGKQFVATNVGSSLLRYYYYVSDVFWYLEMFLKCFICIDNTWTNWCLSRTVVMYSDTKIHLKTVLGMKLICNLKSTFPYITNRAHSSGWISCLLFIWETEISVNLCILCVHVCVHACTSKQAFIQATLIG